MLLSLHAAGLEVHCLAMNTSKHYFPLDQVPEALRKKIHCEDVACDNRLRPLAMAMNLLFSRIPYVAQRFNLKSYHRKLTAMLETGSYDLVQLEGPYLGHYLSLVRQHSKARLILRAHNVEHIIWERKAQQENSHVRRWYLGNMSRRLRRFEFRVAEACDALLPISQVDEEYFRKAGLHIPSLTIPTGLSLEDYPLTPPPSSPSLFFIGALDWLPNQEGLRWFLEEVFPSLHQASPDLILHIAGRNAPPAMERLCQAPGIRYHGEVENARAFMQEYRVMIAPLFTGSGIRIKILEAMALGRPVVTTPVGIEGIPARHGKHVAIGTSAEAFKNQIIELLDDDKSTLDKVQSAREMIRENFDTFGLSERLGRFLNEQL
jgi:glycosyltransferase involved in cell wall biosynthesis